MSNDNTEWNVTGNNISGTVTGPGLNLTAITNGNFKIENNNFTNNSLGLFLNCTSNSNVLVKGNEISNNTSNGGMSVNMAILCTADISGNTISGNNNTASGGGVRVTWDPTSTLTIRGNETTGNTTDGSGGGLYLQGTSNSSDFVTQNNIHGNTDTTPGEGGAQLYYAGPLTPALNLQNNWWGHVVPPALTNAEIFNLTVPNVDVSNPAQSAFPAPPIP